MANVMSLLRPLLLDNVPSIQQSVREPFIFLNPYPYPLNPYPYPLHYVPWFVPSIRTVIPLSVPLPP
jgi:hypothetical protein